MHLYEAICFLLVGQQYDLIISNPPYVPYEMQELPAEYLQEPDMAFACRRGWLIHCRSDTENSKDLLKSGSAGG